MNTFDDVTDETFQSVIGRKVIDDRGDTIGTLDALWTDETSGKVEFLGVKTGWLLGKTHVVPARGVEIHDDYIRVPYDTQRVKDAPSYPAEEPLSDAQEREVAEYYGGTTPAGIATAGTSTTGTSAVRTETAGTTGLGAETAGPRVAGSETTGAEAVEAGTAGAALTGAELAGTRRGARAEDQNLGEQRRARTGMVGETREGAAGEVEIPIEEERLRVEKREVGAGRVRLRKVVRTEQVNVPVELRREDVVVERVPAEQVRTGEPSDFAERDVELEVRREEPVIEKERVVTGAVRARRTEAVEQQTVSDSVRKADVEVDRSGLSETARAGETATGASATEAEREAERERQREERNL